MQRSYLKILVDASYRDIMPSHAKKGTCVREMARSKITFGLARAGRKRSIIVMILLDSSNNSTAVT